MDEACASDLSKSDLNIFYLFSCFAVLFPICSLFVSLVEKIEQNNISCKKKAFSSSSIYERNSILIQ
jgi:hypothetical protein